MIDKNDLKNLEDNNNKLLNIKKAIGMVKFRNPPSKFKNKKDGLNAEIVLIKAQEFIDKAIQQLNRIL